MGLRLDDRWQEMRRHCQRSLIGVERVGKEASTPEHGVGLGELRWADWRAQVGPARADSACQDRRNGVAAACGRSRLYPQYLADLPLLGVLVVLTTGTSGPARWCMRKVWYELRARWLACRRMLRAR
jgi:hypothetical protein